jgi:hypothetical protein
MLQGGIKGRRIKKFKPWNQRDAKIIIRVAVHWLQIFFWTLSPESLERKTPEEEAGTKGRFVTGI